MSWYRSYVQEASLYSTSPSSNPLLLSDTTLNSPAAFPHGTAPCLSSPGGQLGMPPSHQQEQGDTHQQPQHHHVSQVKSSHMQQHVDGVGAIRAAPAAALSGRDESLLTLTAALEAAWAGGTAATCRTPAPAATASVGSPRTMRGRMQGCPPLVMRPLPVSRCCSPPGEGVAPAAATVDSQQQARQGTDRATAPVSTARAAAEAAPAAQAAPGPDTLPRLGQVPTDLFDVAWGGGHSRGSDAAPASQLQQEQQQRPQQQQQEQEQQQQCEVAPAATRGAVVQSVGVDLLCFDLCWEGPGLRRRVTNASTETNGSSSSSRVSPPTPAASLPPPPQHQQQQQQQRQQDEQLMSHADDSWEALVSSMRQCHPDNSSTPAATSVATVRTAAGAAGGAAPGQLQADAAVVAAGKQGKQPGKEDGKGACNAAAAAAPQRSQETVQTASIAVQLPPQPWNGRADSGSSSSNRGAAAAAGGSSTASSGCAEITAVCAVTVPSGSRSSSSNPTNSGSSTNTNSGSSVGRVGAVGSSPAPSRGTALSPRSPRAGSTTIPFLSGFGPTIATTTVAAAPAGSDVGAGAAAAAGSNGARGSCGGSSSGRQSLGPLSPRANAKSIPLLSSSNAELPGPRSPRPAAEKTPLLRSSSIGSIGGSTGVTSAGKAAGKQQRQQPVSPRGAAAAGGWLSPPLLRPLDSTTSSTSPFKSSGSSTSSGRSGSDPKPLLSRRGQNPSQGVNINPSSPPSSPGSMQPLLRSSSSSSSSLQLARLGPLSAQATAGSGSSSSGRGVAGGQSNQLGQRSFVQSVRVRIPPGRPMGWWVCGGLAVAAVAGGAVAAVYGIMTYFLKMSMMYSLAWKAATGVAAVEGLAVGGWSCKTVRVQQAEAAQSAAEASRLRQQAGQELGAMRALLEQHKATHTHEVSSLAALNERLTRLTHSLQSENASLQGALERAAAERKALEAAAALEVKRAEASALVGATAEATGRVAGEVEQLTRSQQVLVALVQEMHEDLMGLVAQRQGAAAAPAAVAAATPAPAVAAAASAPASAGATNAAALGAVTSDTHVGEAFVAPVPAVTTQQTQPAGGEDGASSGSASSIDSTSSCTIAGTLVPRVSQGEASRLGSEELSEGLVRVSSVRGGVQAALAATVCQTLEL